MYILIFFEKQLTKLRIILYNKTTERTVGNHGLQGDPFMCLLIFWV